jgi:hypothetical protein
MSRLKAGEVFVMKLKNVDDTHELKIAEALDTNIAVLTQNGSRDGFFTLLTQEPGKHKSLKCTTLSPFHFFAHSANTGSWVFG